MATFEFYEYHDSLPMAYVDCRVNMSFGGQTVPLAPINILHSALPTPYTAADIGQALAAMLDATVTVTTPATS